MKNRIKLTAILFLMGVGWGITIPLTKIAVSTGHQPLGLIFWQLVIVVVVLGTVNRLRGKPFCLARRYWRLFVMVALLGAVLPDVAFYAAAAGLPAGVLSIVMASTPMFSLTIARTLGMDRLSWRRLLGVGSGMAGIILLIGPDTSLPEGIAPLFVFIALLAPLLYATEGNLVALWGTQDLDPVQTILGASVIGILLTFPLATASGQWINPLNTFGVAESALLAGATIHALVYAGYVWLVRHAGAVFASQLSYIVNGSGVLWSILLLGERYSAWIWAALCLMIAGLMLVRPRPPRTAPQPTAKSAA